MSQKRLQAFQIEVLDFSKRDDRYRSDAVIPDGRGIFRCGKCHWEGEQTERCPRCRSTKLSPKGRIKVVDIHQPLAPRRTLVELFYNAERAKKWASRFGMVISCVKVDKTRYLENIEHLNLAQPIAVELEQDYVLSRTLELERPRKAYYDDGKREIEISEPLDKE